MTTETTRYRVTIERPVDGRMHKPGDVVVLSARAVEAERGWGGLEPVVEAEPAAASGPVDGVDDVRVDEPQAPARRRKEALKGL